MFIRGNKFLMELYGKLSRLYHPGDMKTGGEIMVDEKQAHYLKNVMRKSLGDTVRIFNGRDGEFIGGITNFNKKGALIELEKEIRKQPAAPAPLHLLFAPIKKDRMDFLIEKATELGVTDIHPVITHRTENRNLNEARLAAQVTEAAEQCERMTVPALHPSLPLKDKIYKWDKNIPLYWCAERREAPPLKDIKNPSCGFLIGPEGGFDDSECAFLATQESIKSVSLGETVYRAETAALLCLAAMNLKNP